MCFSATASFAVGVALSATGVVTIKKASSKKELPLAMIPLVFGVQQAIKGGVWLSLGSGSLFLNSVTTYAFIFIAYVLWPVLIPLAVGLVETDPHRRSILYGFQGVGVVVGMYLLSFIIQNPIASHIVNESIVYTTLGQYGLLPIVLYVLATCVSCLFSSSRTINLFGIFATLSLAAAYYFYTVSYISVWCFFGALLSICVFWYFKK